MGLMAIRYVLTMEKKPKRLVVTDINEDRIAKARRLIPVQEAQRNGVELYYINPSMMVDPASALLALTNEKGYDDVFVYAPPKNVAENREQDHGHGRLHEYLRGNGGQEVQGGHEHLRQPLS